MTFLFIFYSVSLAFYAASLVAAPCIKYQKRTFFPFWEYRVFVTDTQNHQCIGILTPHYEVEHWYWPLTMRCRIDADPSLWGKALILTPHYEVEHWYWPLTMRWSIDADPSLWGGALMLTPHYEVEHWYWPLTMRWSIDTDPLTMRWSIDTEALVVLHASPLYGSDPVLTCHDQSDKTDAQNRLNNAQSHIDWQSLGHTNVNMLWIR